MPSSIMMLFLLHLLFIYYFMRLYHQQAGIPIPFNEEKFQQFIECSAIFSVCPLQFQRNLASRLILIGWS